MSDLLYHSYRQIQELERALGALRKAGFGELTLPYQQINKLRGEVMAKLGFRRPKISTLLKIALGLSPGSIKVFHDAESGWLVEARVKPGAAPIYHYVDDKTAMAVLKGELTKELETTLMTPDDYLGE